MSIQELPASAVRLIGSSQAIIDPASVVKELVDNALDAGCQAVFVEVSNDTLETIQVRDNGHGVAQEDRSLLCKPHCTSKIRQFSDIRDVGGRSLGFRGEALACIAELSGCFSITTKVEEEHVGVSFSFRKNGSIEREESASHPLGTTVRVSDLFRNIPVRKQTALKKTSETLTKIKRLLQAYAFTRPNVRLSLKILKAKNGKSQWNYVPKSNGMILDTAREVVGNECARNYSYLELQSDGYLIQSLLPNSQADTTAINNIGQFLSVDSRSVSNNRGVFKQIVKACKDELKNNVSGDLKNPFFWVNIVCPSRSYDPNVEPAKDDLAFEDKDKLLGAIHALLASCYSNFEKPSNSNTTKDHDFQGCPWDVQHPEQIHENGSAENASSNKRKFFATSMYSLDDDELPESGSYAETEHCSLSDAEEDTQRELRDPKVSNPWIIAKLHSSTRNKQHRQILETPHRNPLRSLNDSETNVQLNSQPCFPAQTICLDTTHAEATAPAPQRHKTATQMVVDNHSIEHDVLGHPRTMSLERPHGFFQGPTKGFSLANEGPSTLSQNIPRRTVKQGCPIIDMTAKETKSRPKRSHQNRQQIDGLFKVPRDIIKQKPFVSPLKQQRRNWFRNSSEYQSPSNTESSVVPARGHGMDIRTALFNAPKPNPTQAVNRIQAEETLSGDNEGSVASLTKWLDQRNSTMTTPDPVSTAMVSQPEPLPLEQIQGYGKSEALIWSSSIEWFARNSDKYRSLSNALFGSVQEDVHEPIWESAVVSPVSSSSFLRPMIRYEEIDDWTHKVVQLLYENESFHQLENSFHPRPADLKIAKALAIHVAKLKRECVA